MAHTLKRALRFPEGLFLLMQNDGLYFLPDGHDTAYQCQGERKELHGKIAHTMKSTNPAVKTYNLAYEFEGDDLIAARLITGASRSKGTLVPAAEQAALAQALDDGRLTLRAVTRGPQIYGAYQLGDGRVLLNIYYLPGHDYEALLLGQPGAYKKLDVATGVQGGNSLRYVLTDNTVVELDWRDQATGQIVWSFGGQPMRPLPLARSAKDLDTYGVTLAATGPHLDPFSPERAKPPRAPYIPPMRGP